MKPATPRQARKAEFYLRRRCGVEAYVAAAPLRDGKVEHKGVDDYLGAGEKLSDLTVMERTESPMIETAKALAIERGVRKDTAENDAEVVRALAHYATKQDDGRWMVQTTLGSLGDMIGRSRTTAANVIKRLIERPVKWITVEGSFATQKGYHVKGEGHFPGPEEWRKAKIDGDRKENPRIYIHPELCGEDKERSLGQLLADLGKAKPEAA